MGRALVERWNFWRRLPQLNLAVFATGLLISGVTMILAPAGYKSFYLECAGVQMTPAWFGLLSIIISVALFATCGMPWALGLLVAVFVARATLLFTAWAGRVQPAPPAARWIWEVCIAIVILLNAPRHDRTRSHP